MTLEEARLRVVEKARAFRRARALIGSSPVARASEGYRSELAWVALRDAVDALEALEGAAGLVR